MARPPVRQKKGTHLARMEISLSDFGFFLSLARRRAPPAPSRVSATFPFSIKARRGPKKAIMAVAASILTAIYHMLKDGTMYKDLGRNHFDRRSSDQQKKRLVKRLAHLGYAVEIKPLAA